MAREVNFDELIHFTDRQKEARKATKEGKYILYGGAMGGGKSYWLRWQNIDLLTDWAAKGHKGVRVGLFCEDYPALKDRHLSKVDFEFPTWLGTMNKADYEFKLSPEYGSGVLCFRNLDDASKYQSAEFAAISIDELTKNKKETFDFLRTRLRWPKIEDVKFLAGSNPGGIGHEWVKQYWLDKKYPLEEEEGHLFKFVKALPTDNPHLTESYYVMLKGLPEKLRKAFLEGNWDVFEGQFFTEFDREKHVIWPIELPLSWPRFRSIDPSGRSGITSCHWYCLDPNRNVYVYREYYSTGKDSDEHAREVARLSGDENYRYTVIDNAAFAKLGLPETIAEIYIRNGVNNLVPSSKKRVMGWDFVHQYLRYDDINEPKLKIFDTCHNLIRTLPLLVHDEHHPEDVDTDGEDHAADELRYFLQTLRDSRAPKAETMVERRLRELKEKTEEYNYHYSKHK